MGFFLNQATQYLEQAMAAEHAGRFPEARELYLKAAEYLFQAARRMPPEQRARRVAGAEELLRLADGLKSRARAPVAEAAGKEEPPWLVAERPSVRFDDVAGLDQVKEQILLRLVYPFTHPEKAQHYGIKRGGGFLFYGPPGTGKTMLARAVAGEIDAPFYTVKPSDIMSKWVGESEQNIARLFESARRHPRAVIFIDEVEALIPKRRTSESTVMQRVVPQILAEMQGFEEHEAVLLFIGATNEPWSLDPAAMRPGRFDEKIYIPLPDMAARRRILEIHTAHRPLDPGVDLDELSVLLEGYSGADIVHLCEKVADAAFLQAIRTGEDRSITLDDFRAVLQELRPSVETKELRKYEEFARKD